MSFRFYKMWDRWQVEINAGHFDLTAWVYRPSYRLRELRDAWRSFAGPCPDCGKKWGKHDETVEHLPF